MIRAIVILLVMFAVPYVVYAFYLYFTGKKNEEGGSWNNAMPWLTLAGAVLAIGGFFAMVAFDRASTDEVYRPAQQQEDGQSRPDGFEQPGE